MTRKETRAKAHQLFVANRLRGNLGTAPKSLDEIRAKKYPVGQTKTFQKGLSDQTNRRKLANAMRVTIERDRTIAKAYSVQGKGRVARKVLSTLKHLVPFYSSATRVVNQKKLIRK